MNESNSLIGKKNGLYIKNIKKRRFNIKSILKLNQNINIKTTFSKVKEKTSTPYCIAILLFILIILIGVFLILLQKDYKNDKLKNLRQIANKKYSNTTLNNTENKTTNKSTFSPIYEKQNKNRKDNNFDFISQFKKEYKYPQNQNPTCQDLDPINSFKNRLQSPSKIICKNSKSQHICYLNKNPKYAGAKGVICKMSNIILDPTKWNPSVYTYKGPVDQDKKGKPNLSKGFFSMKCANPSFLEDYNHMYDTYFNGWDYLDDNYTDNNTYEELAPGKTIFFLSRNQDSPNLYHGGSEFINALSLMYLFDLEPENIIIFFLESMTIEDDPFYDLYSNLIGRGGKPIYPKNLNMTKKYFISNAIHIPINWDSPCFILSGVPSCQNPTLTYYFLNKLVDKYMNIIDYKDLFQSDGDIYYYPKSVQNYSSSINFTKTITFQWRRVWPKGRKNQYRILGNGPELADKLAAALPSNILLRLIDTASLPMAEQISIMKKTDYFVGMHGAGLTLSIFSPNHCIFHEVLHQHNMNGLLLFASLSGHKTYSDTIESTKKIVDTNELIFFNEDQFVNKVLSHMKENNLI